MATAVGSKALQLLESPGEHHEIRHSPSCFSNCIFCCSRSRSVAGMNWDSYEAGYRDGFHHRGNRHLNPDYEEGYAIGLRHSSYDIR